MRWLLTVFCLSLSMWGCHSQRLSGCWLLGRLTLTRVPPLVKARYQHISFLLVGTLLSFWLSGFVWWSLHIFLFRLRWAGIVRQSSWYDSTFSQVCISFLQHVVVVWSSLILFLVLLGTVPFFFSIKKKFNEYAILGWQLRCLKKYKLEVDNYYIFKKNTELKLILYGSDYFYLY